MMIRRDPHHYHVSNNLNIGLNVLHRNNLTKKHEVGLFSILSGKNLSVRTKWQTRNCIRKQKYKKYTHLKRYIWTPCLSLSLKMNNSKFKFWNSHQIRDQLPRKTYKHRFPVRSRSYLKIIEKKPFRPNLWPVTEEPLVGSGWPGQSLDRATRRSFRENFSLIRFVFVLRNAEQKEKEKEKKQTG